LAEARQLVARGFKEIVLTGAHIGLFGKEREGAASLTDLLVEMLKLEGDFRIRLSSLEPHELETKIIEMAAGEPWLCPHFHIPLQSGDDRILKKMNRRYTTKDFAEKIERIHAAIPRGAIGVDIMAGFPGEDAAAHENAVSLLRNLPVSYLHVFPFSPRKGTPAWHYKERVHIDTIKERASELRALGLEKRMLFHENCLGQDFDVLVEGPYANDTALMKGAGENYLPFVFPRDDRLQGRVVRMRATQVCGNGVLGKRLP